MFHRLSTTQKVLIPVVLVAVLSAAGQVWYNWAASNKNAILSAERSAELTIAQYKMLRSYYTKNVVKKLKAAGLGKIHYNHKDSEGTIPLPATMIHDLSKELEKSGLDIKLRLYSDKPFPNRKDRVLDDFQKEAIAHLKKNPEATYIREFFEKGNEHVRVAIADRLTASACVSCHNSHPETPFRDWKLGDVRGILEVERFIGKDLEASAGLAADMGSITGGSTLAISLVVGLVLFFLMKVVRRSLGVVQGTVSETSESMQQIKTSADQASEATTSQASAIQETVATLDEINAMVSRGVEAANKTRELSNTTRKNAEEGKASMGAMVRSIGEISESNTVIMSEIDKSNERIGQITEVIQEISNKTQVINDIVFQTKLLSFNASVEAARAGEHGKGFAVVAEEVGNLAEMSGAAAKEIGDMLSSSIGRVQEIVAETKTKVSQLANTGKSKIESGVGIAQRCESILDDVFKDVEKVDGMMEDIAMASKEQAEGVSNISAAMNELDQSTQTNARIAHETSDRAEQMQAQATELKRSVEQIESILMGGDSVVPVHVDETKRSSVAVASTKVIPMSQRREQKQKSPEKEPINQTASGDIPSAEDPRFEDF